MVLLFIYGPPASGKLTVAKELAHLTGYKLFHNHLTVDLVGSIFEYGSPQASRLSLKFRLEMFEAAAKADIDGVIFTFVYAYPLDNDMVKQMLEAVENNGGEVKFVQLLCNKEVLLKRVEDESRKPYKKIKDQKGLSELIEKYDLVTKIPFKESLIIDNTNLDPVQVAQKIISHFNLPLS